MQLLETRRGAVNRITAVLTAAVLLIPAVISWTSGTMQANAQGVTIRPSFQGNMLKEGAHFTFYGKESERTGMWGYQAVIDNTTYPVFCMEPTKKMYTGATGDFQWYELGRDPLPLGITEEQAEALYYALVIAGNYPGTEGKIAELKGNYMMVQSAVWAILSDEWDIDNFKSEVENKIIPNAKDPNVGPQILKYVEEYVFNAKDMCSRESVPEFASRYENLAPAHKMKDDGDGTYSITFTTDGSWQQNYLEYSFEHPEGWEYSKNGDEVTFVCKNGDPGSCGLVTGAFQEGTRWEKYWYRPTKLGIITPTGSDGSRRQMQIAVAGEKAPWAAYFRFGNENGGGPSIAQKGGFTLEYNQYLHEETFHRNYRVELDKLDSETGKPLRDSYFEVLEQFDFGQLEGTNLERGQFEDSAQEGKFGELTVCEERIVTDSSGHFSHSDEKTYDYVKTYCGGHPDPVIEYVEAGEDSSEEDGEAAEEENERLEEEAWAAWQECVEWCEENCDFHSISEGEARSELERDRDEAYENFINLERTYTVREVMARGGYILHDLHNDDIPVEIVTFASSEAGGRGIVTGSYPGNRDNGLPSPSKAVLSGMSSADRATPSVARREADILRVSLVKEESGGENGESEEKLSAEEMTVESEEPESEPAEQPADGERTEEAEESVKEKEDILETGENVKEAEDMEEESREESGADAEQPEVLGAAEADKDSSVEEAGGSEGEPEAAETAAEPELHRATDSEAQETIYELRPWKRPEILTESGGWEWDGIQLESEIAPVDRSGRPGGDCGYLFTVSDHRTEGEIHINKRDLELYGQDTSQDKADSYGKTQGDGTLEGAVYGLYACDDILHPDGVTGRVFRTGDLVAVAATDQNGDASFVVITEVSDTSKEVPNLCSENEIQNGNQWIGRPLILGNYYIQEITRSEGYELSRTGIHLSESNRTGTPFTITAAGSVRAGELTHRLNEWDGSWNDVAVEYFGTKGCDLFVTGCPPGMKFYKVENRDNTVREHVVTGTELVEKRGPDGEILYRKAEGGEYKRDSSGNRIPETDAEGKPVYGSVPQKITLQAVNRLNLYIESITRMPADQELEGSGDIDPGYIAEEVETALADSGYKTAGQDSPWEILVLDGVTNGEMIDEILDFCAGESFWDAYRIGEIRQEDGVWKAAVQYSYQALKNGAVYEAPTGRLFVRASYGADQGSGTEGFCYVIYEEGDYEKNGLKFTVEQKRAAEPVIHGKPIILEPVYEVLYKTYTAGEILMDHMGNPIPQWESRPVYGDITTTDTEEVLEELTEVSYDAVTGICRIHLDTSGIDWSGRMEAETLVIRAKAPLSSIDVDGYPMAYADYLKQYRNASVNVFSSKEAVPEGSYVKEVFLLYPGQRAVYQDAGTREKPVVVLERVIRQAIRVTKDIAQDSYEKINFYKIHRDPFTVLFGGYHGNDGTKTLPGFYFKLYRKNALESTGYLEKTESGASDYERLFKEHPELGESMALEWDDPRYDADGDLTTLHAARGGGKDDYWGTSVALPYGTYVIVEQQPTTIPTRHYQIGKPKEIVLPFVPWVDGDGTVHDKIPSKEFLYDARMEPEDLAERYKIRFNEEFHVIKAHNHDGDFEVFKYGLEPDSLRDCGNRDVAEYYHCGSVSEDKGVKDGVYYETLYDREGNVTDYGVTRDGVDSMSGISTAVDRLYAPALVPWSVLEPRYGGVINDDGDVGNRDTGLEADGSFNYVAFASEDLENHFYRSRIRIEKLDGETEENIIHDGALFKIYAASREITGDEAGGVSGSGKVIFNPDGSPVYDPAEQIFLKDETGAEVGIFKGFSTVRDGSVTDTSGETGVEKRCVGYIETCQPLGAGVYVLVEVKAPEGYVKSRPVAFEVYSDEVKYYPEGGSGGSVTAPLYQYVREVNPKGVNVVEDVHQIKVVNTPSHVRIHKTEQGGEQVTYLVRGTEKQLKARGDVTLCYNPDGSCAGYGYVTKRYDEWSEHIVTGTEEELRQTPEVEPLYQEDGTYTGMGIRYDKYVGKATLTLYKALVVRQTGEHTYDGVTVKRNWNDSVLSITAVKTGTTEEVRDTGEEDDQKNKIWDITEEENPPAKLWRYDLDRGPVEIDENTGVLYGLDDRGNRVCRVDSETGMAYVLDSRGDIMVWPLDDEGNKIRTQSIEIYTGQDGKQTIYTDLSALTDENGLPVYYQNGKVTMQDNEWSTPVSGGHEIVRIPFGAYILEETIVPFRQGYIQTEARGILVEESGDMQDFYMSDDFTKLEVSKLDVAAECEVEGALLTLYEAIRVTDSSHRGWHLEKAVDSNGEERIYASWISGYEYDDDGNLKLDALGNRVVCSKPRWLDHVPVGDYILEETRPPEESGYTGAGIAEVFVKETGEVQSAVLTDDHTAAEFMKTDEDGRALPREKGAQLAIYKAVLNDTGEPVYNGSGEPVYDPGQKIFSWAAEDGSEVLKTAHEVTLPGGHTYIAYVYDKKKVPGQSHAVYYVTERGAMHIDYLPVGKYVWVEEKAPDGMAPAKPVYVNVLDIGSEVQVQTHTMVNRPIRVEIHKTDIAGGKELFGAEMAVYRADGSGGLTQTEAYLYETWISGTDGVYTLEDEADGKIPAGANVGDRKPHRITGIPEGKYYLVETLAPFGLCRAARIPFTVTGTDEIQSLEMVDEMPKGRLEIYKHEAENSEKPLTGAKFRLTNLDTGEKMILITGKDGKAESGEIEVGEMLDTGLVKFFTYRIQEISAPSGHMLDSGAHEFQFEYRDAGKAVLVYRYSASNRANQVRISKRDLTGRAELPGAKLEVRTATATSTPEGSVKWEEGEIVESWTSTAQPHYVNHIPEGTYVLIETQPPSNGYAVSERIYFEIRDNMTEVPAVVMNDRPTEVEVRKTDRETGELLPGARLQMRAERTGVVLREWESGTTGEKFYALEPGIYTITELSPPVGWSRMEPITIEVRESWEPQIFTIADSPIEVEIGKTDEENKESLLSGAEFRLTRMEDEEIIREWISGERRETFKRLRPGTYLLTETKAPPGWQKTEAVIIEVTDRPGIQIFDATDRKIQVEIDKVDGENGKILSGARLQITEEATGKIIKTWVSGLEPERFEGLPPGRYAVKELEAPSGYRRMNPVVIEITEESGSQEFHIKNYELDHNGGGGEEKPEKKRMSIKKTGPGGELLGGAEFSVWDEAGNLYVSGAADESGVMEFELPPAGTYHFQETKAPAGYYQLEETFYFIVEKDGKVRGQTTVRDTPKTDITVTKKDADTGECVAGCKFQILDEDGNIMFDGATGQEGTTEVTIGHPGTYHLRETKAPDGYEVNEADIEFSVDQEGHVAGSTVIYDYPLGAEQPKTGRVLAAYKSKFAGRGKRVFGKRGEVVLGVRTGDDAPLGPLLVLLFLSLVGIMTLLWKRRKGRIPMAAIFLAVAVSLPVSHSVHAAEDGTHVEERNYKTADRDYYGEEGTFPETVEIDGKNYVLERVEREVIKETPIRSGEVEREVIVTSPPFTDGIEQHPPADYYEKGGRRYRLESFRCIPARAESEVREVSQTIVYHDMEQVDAVPPDAEITVVDETTGESREVTLPLIKYQLSGYQWKDGFCLPVTIQGYDRDAYVLGNQLVPRDDEAPLAGFDEELLQLAGLSPEYYQIENISWDGEPYETAGVWHRKAIAEGRKMVAECSAVYGGLASYGAEEGQAVQAKYIYTGPEIVTEYDMKAVATYVQKKRGRWAVMLEVCKVTIALGLIAFLLAVIILVWNRRREDEKQ